ncbi:hypothetical protein [Bacillus sp. UNC41MFS5]|uniref:hypothetical protein n=1 Tax=Bacillus sp. UNC41MFS5 TaxID=1449046 RepID=UPI000691A4C8|nr:hypothetical protein [Bacillus sp. UNC41MFS5]
MKVSYILDVIIAITSPLYEWRSIDTRRIDSHIHQLNKQPWFQELYQDEKYRKLFVMNYRTRRYLDSPFRVKRLMNSPKAQLYFLKLLNKQLERKEINHEKPLW